MKNILFLSFLLLTLSSKAQYYYNDIIGTLETNRQMKTYQVNKVRTISASGYDQRNVKASDFVEFQEIKENGTALKITTHNNSNNTIYYNRFDNQGRLISITDSSTDIQSITTYEYDANGRITLVKKYYERQRQ